MSNLLTCSLNGVSLTGLDVSICVLDIQEDSPLLRNSFSPVQPDGQQLLCTGRDSLTVRIRFGVYEPAPIRRRKLLRQIHAWADAGGNLTISDRPDQRLQVICSELPAACAEDWTETLTLAFTTTLCPYWEDLEPTSYTVTDLLPIVVPGTASTATAEVEITNISADPITRLELYCGKTQMIFEGIELPAGGVFTLYHTNGVLSAQAAGRSVLAHRTPESADLLLASCGGDCILYASADQAISSVFTLRGRYA